MRQLSVTLQAAQRQPEKTPAVKVCAINQNSGVIRQKWSRLYTGAEPEYYHGLTIPGDGSLIRVRITPLSDSRKIYRQRVTDPSPAGDFSQWVYTGQYNAIVIAAASYGSEVSIIWVETNREIKRIKSTDNGVTWSTPETVDVLSTASVTGITASYTPDGSLAVFFTEQATLYVKKCLGGQWQAKVAWDKNTGLLSGVGSIYDEDWKLLVTGQDASGNYKAWSLVYGDGGGMPAGVWSALKEVATAPAGGDFAFKQPFLDKPDTVRCFFIESFTGIQAYERPFTSYVIPGTDYTEGLWREPAPFNLSSEYGLAMAHHGEFAWLSSASGVWRSSAAAPMLDLSGDVVAVRQVVAKTAGALKVELVNYEAKYASPGQGSLAMLDRGCTLQFRAGYLTPSGAEYGEAQSYTIKSFEHVRSGGNSRLIIHAGNGWENLGGWQATQQLRWNRNGNESSLESILRVILAKAGLKLSVISRSSTIAGFYPDFTVNPGNNGKDIVRKLLSMVTDKIFIEGNTAFLVNPQPEDAALYAYGAGHVILSAKYGRDLMDVGRTQVEGWNPSAGKIILVDVFPENGDDLYGRTIHIEDWNLDNIVATGERGNTVLRQAAMELDESSIIVPVNCGQQLFDVVSVTDELAGQDAQNKRVTGIALVYNPGRGEYFQSLKLGKV